METLAAGFGLVEGPCPDGEGGVYFTDAIGGGVHRRTADGRVETVLPKRRGVGGLALHADGGLIVTGRGLLHWRAGEEDRLLLSPEGVTGFNDVGVLPDGRVLAGALRYNPLAGGEDPVPGEVWAVAGENEAELLIEDIVWPNGIACSPDGAVVYVCDYERAHVVAAGADGSGQRVFASAPEGASCDGIAVDVDGAVWVALGADGTVGRFTADGSLDRTLDVPADFVASVAFDDSGLLIATAGSLLRTDVGVEGAPVPLARV